MFSVNRDKADVRGSQCGMDNRVIEAVACESINLVDDAVSNRVIGNVVKHLLQRSTPDCLC